jgi:hypothetical protein
LPLALVTALLTAAVAARPAAAQEEEIKIPVLLNAKSVEVKGADDDLRRLQKARYNAALDEGKARFNEYLAGRGGLEKLMAAARRVLESGLELNTGAADRIQLRVQLLELAREVEKISQAKYEAGRLPVAEMARARYLRADAEIQLLQARRDAAQGKGKAK